MKKGKNIFFHGRRLTPNPTSPVLRGYNCKQPLRTCGVAGLIKNIFLPFFMCFCFQFLSLKFSNADTVTPQVCHNDNCVTVEVVSKDADLERGLMFRSSLGKDQGMLFVFASDDRYKFWMKNMHFNLDMLWISHDGHIVYVGQDIPACSADPCPVYDPGQNARYVLEINSGYAASHHWLLGDKIDLKGI